ncbi:transcriptional regulator [Actinorhabdospora filicis]|uniref:Transcriptional regulator n=1 Tax=Actinorhabdospora filicis TaxID=1785913 RepID=A0A9W6SR17_9ACTN|nr:helix-turn-helix transcriptional regulator [Actinorhabdospora filicis]GLZ80731.1 transcriptional regulator [Actinorhabdospora filicis]
MAKYHKWSDIRAEYIEQAGGEAVVKEKTKRLKAWAHAYLLVEKRKNFGLTQADVGRRMGVSKARVSQIERGEVSTVGVLSRYVAALGGRIRVIADFEGEEVPLTFLDMLLACDEDGEKPEPHAA